MSSWRQAPQDFRAQPTGNTYITWSKAWVADGNRPTTQALASGGLGDRPVHPAHHAAQLAAGLLDRVRGRLLAPLGEVGPAGVVLGHPLAGELATLDLREDLAHLVLDPPVDDARAARVVAVLGRVRDAVPHPRDAALVHEVDDQLQ